MAVHDCERAAVTSVYENVVYWFISGVLQCVKLLENTRMTSGNSSDLSFHVELNILSSYDVPRIP